MDVLELTRELVAIDSQNPGALEPEIARYVDGWARERGFTSRIVEPIAGRPNVIISLDGGGPGHWALSGHLDTKPVGDALSSWNTDPLELVIDGDDAYGLGTTDMKGGVAAMMVALERLAATPPAHLGRLSLVLTADEEQGSDCGAKALVAEGLVDELEAIVIAEPSGILTPWEGIYLVSRGICCFEVEVRTRQGHSGLSHLLGRNAVLVAADLVHAFESFSPVVDSPGEVACSPTVNPGIFISGGVSYGTWPGACTVAVEVRLVPGMLQSSLHAQIAQFIEQAIGDRSEYAIRYKDSSQGWMPAVELSPNTPIARAARKATQTTLGRAVPFSAFPGGTDATYFQGAARIPTIASLGPGWISLAHGANEKVGVSQLSQAVDIFENLAHEYINERTAPTP